MILHVDMDAFYASVEERDQPALVGKPLIVGGKATGRGVVAAANYVARRFGVHSAMPTVTALKLCPQAIVLWPRMEHYAAISEQLRQIFFQYTPLVEPLSLDEAFLDVSGRAKTALEAAEIARELKTKIHDELHLVASIGVAPNKFLAKVASDLEKPDALVIVLSDQVERFLDPLPVSRIWGVGKVTQRAFQQLGIQSIADLKRLSVEILRHKFGKQGEHFWELAHGRDNRPVVADREAKSISHETTFATDISDMEILRAWLLELTEHVCRRLRKKTLVGRTVQLKIRFSDFQTLTRGSTLAQPTNQSQFIWRTAEELLRKSLPNPQPIRLIGISLSGLEAPRLVQRLLFDEEVRQKQVDLDAISDAIRLKFGADALSPGSGLLHNARHRPEPRPRTDSE